MHVLLLKEPRDGGSGPDPYIRVGTTYLNPLVFFKALAVSADLHFLCFTFHWKFWEGFVILISQELASHGHKATLIPVLSFKFVSLNTLSDKVNSTVTMLNFVFFIIAPPVVYRLFKMLLYFSFSNQKNMEALYLPVQEL